MTCPPNHGKMRRIKMDNEKDNIITDKLALKMAAALEKVQQRFTRTMNRIFGNMGRKRAKWITGVFALVCGGYSLYLISGVFCPAKGNESFSVEQIRRPEYLDKRNSQTDNREVVDERTFQNIEAYRLFLDSVKKVNQPLYERIVTDRPGLLDSIKLLEDIYYSQQNSVYEK